MVSTIFRRPALLLVLMAGCSSAGNFAGRESAGRDTVDEALAAPRHVADTRPKAPVGRTGTSPTRPDPALEASRRAKKIADHLADASRAKQADNPAAARDAYERILQLDPEHSQANYELATLADNEGRFADSARHYQVLLRRNPRNADLLASLGWSYFLQERYDESERTLREALVIDPRNKFAHGNLGWLLGARGDYDGALVELRAGESEADAQRAIAELFPDGRPASARPLAGETPRNPFGQSGNVASATRGSVPRSPGQPVRGTLSAPAIGQRQGVATAPPLNRSIVPAGATSQPAEGGREFDELFTEADLPPQAGGIQPAGYDRAPPAARAGFPQITPRATGPGRSPSAQVALDQVEPAAASGVSGFDPSGRVPATTAAANPLPEWPRRPDVAVDAPRRTPETPRPQSPLATAARLGLAAGPGGLLFPAAPR